MEIWNQFGLTLAVLALLVGLLFWLHKRGFVSSALITQGRTPGKTRQLQIVDKVSVAPQHTLVLVQVDGAKLLVCLSPSGGHTTVLKGGAE